ncbi:hypothetical protein [Flavobacterium sp. N1994]|uniref:hypothetical protein n=1 Tax=Flavobacterium sp. N1994 TaxID=2986827 RepID=UPI00222336BC|nr:hypothetical protein [Flavobacterium sp. N1994]
MNERWTYQLKKGLPFGIIMPIIITAIEGYGTSYTEAFLSIKFLIELVLFLFVGIFIIGYSSWREKRKNNEYNDQK